MFRAENFIFRSICTLFGGLMAFAVVMATPSFADDVATQDTSNMDEFQFDTTKLYFPNESSSAAIRNRMSLTDPATVQRAHLIRRWAVKSAGKVLFWFRRPLGTFVVVRGKVRQMFPSRHQLNRWFKAVPDPHTEDEKRLENQVKNSELANEKIAAILGGLNSYLLESAAVIATSAEEGVMFSVGIQGEVGGARFGRGGAYYLDVYIGYNREKDSLIVSLQPRRETYKGGITASFGLPMKIQYYWSTSETATMGSQRHGVAIYPPGTAWASSVHELSAHGFTSVGVYGLFGADLSGGALPLTNHAHGLRAIRLSIPLSRGGWSKFFKFVFIRKEDLTACDQSLVAKKTEPD